MSFLTSKQKRNLILSIIVFIGLCIAIVGTTHNMNKPSSDALIEEVYNESFTSEQIYAQEKHLDGYIYFHQDTLYSPTTLAITNWKVPRQSIKMKIVYQDTLYLVNTKSKILVSTLIVNPNALPNNIKALQGYN